MQLETGVNVLFGPSSGLDAYAIRSVANLLHVPFINVDWVANPPTDLGDLTVNFYPQGNFIGRAVLALVLEYKWRKMVLVYEEDDGKYILISLLIINTKLDMSLLYGVSVGLRDKGERNICPPPNLHPHSKMAKPVIVTFSCSLCICDHLFYSMGYEM